MANRAVGENLEGNTSPEWRTGSLLVLVYNCSWRFDCCHLLHCIKITPSPNHPVVFIRHYCCRRWCIQVNGDMPKLQAKHVRKEPDSPFSVRMLRNTSIYAQWRHCTSCCTSPAFQSSLYSELPGPSGCEYIQRKCCLTQNEPWILLTHVSGFYTSYPK